MIYLSLINENPLTPKAIESLKELGIDLTIHEYDVLTFVTSLDKRFECYYAKNILNFATNIFTSGLRIYEKDNSDNEIIIPIDCVDTIYDL